MKKAIISCIALLTALTGMAQDSSDVRTYVRKVNKEVTRLSVDRISHASKDENALLYGESGRISLKEIDSLYFRTVDVPHINIICEEHPELHDPLDKETWLNVKVSMEGNGYVEDFKPTEAKLRLRGNTSSQMPKKPMRIKFNSKKSIGGMQKAKNYCLIANFIDASLMKNSLAYEIGRRMGAKFTPAFLPCDVTFNGKVRGNYILTHKIGINKASVDIDESKGILFELSTEYDEDYQFQSANYNLPVMVKDPDFKELEEEDSTLTAEARLELWREDFEKAESLLKAGRGSEAFDYESFANYLLVFDVTLNNEIAHPKSVYLHKAKLSNRDNKLGKEEKYVFGPVWDFDLSANKYVIKEGEIHDMENVERELPLNHIFRAIYNDPEFQPVYRERMRRFIEEVYPEIDKWIEDYSAFIEPSADMNGMLWDRTIDYGWVLAQPSIDHRKKAADLRRWLKSRVEMLKERYSIY